MSVLVYRSTELQDLSVRRCWGELRRGWRDGVLSKGTNAEVASAAGEDDLPRLARYRELELDVTVLGTDAANWDAVNTTLESIFDPTLAAANLVVHSPYKGLAAGTRTISCYVAETPRVVVVVENYISVWQVVLHAPGVNWS